MKIVSINESPTHEDGDGAIRAELTDIGKIINRIDHAEGRNDALKAYIYALRDLQRAHDRYAFEDDLRALDLEIAGAKAKVAREFDRLIVAEFTLNRPSEKGADGGASHHRQRLECSSCTWPQRAGPFFEAGRP